MSVSDLLNLSGWQVTAVEEHEDRYTISALSLPCSSSCPECKSISIVKHGKDRQLIHDLPCHAKHVSIVFDRQRYRCRACKKTWFAPLSEVDERRFATLRLVCHIQKRSLTHTYAEVSFECGLDEKTIRNLFHDHVTELEQTVRLSTPVVMGMDELYLLGKPRGMITNVETREFVEMLPDRKKQTILQFLTNLPNKDNIRVCVIDMWRPYLEAINEALPHVTVVIDKFHVVKQLNEIVETVRKEVRGSLNERQRRTLMHDRFILLKRERDLEEKDRLIMESWFATFPRLGAVHACKEAFYHIYEATTQEEAISRYFEWIELVKQRGVFDAFLDLLFTIENWGEFHLRVF